MESQMDPIGRLQRKIKDVRRQRDELEQKLQKDDEGVQRLTQQIDEKKRLVEAQGQKAVDNKQKLERTELLITESEKSLKKIIETSLALEKALDQEIAA